VAKNTNQVTLSGNLVRDPELRETPSGVSVCEMRLAVNNGQSKDGKAYPVTYIDVVAWNGRGETCAKYLSKGRFIVASGRLDYREWEKDGEKRSKHQLTALDIEFGPLPKNGEQSASAEGGAPAPAAADDDIPF
jgi:single-strand DNA-binding protein